MTKYQTLQEQFTMQQLTHLREQNMSLQVRVQKYEDLLKEALAELKKITTIQAERADEV